ncbi:hypothetical protein RAG37_12850 [Klebsiella pneumoniae]
MPKVPLIAFLGLMHLRIALLLFVLGRAGCLNDGGIHQSALGHHDACFGQPAIDGLEQLTGQLMLLEQVAEIHPDSTSVLQKHNQSLDKYAFLRNSAFTHWVKEKCSKIC